eukprot:1141864-Pelagomonas_calceolata.AAC.3
MAAEQNILSLGSRCHWSSNSAMQFTQAQELGGASGGLWHTGSDSGKLSAHSCKPGAQQVKLTGPLNKGTGQNAERVLVIISFQRCVLSTGRGELTAKGNTPLPGMAADLILIKAPRYEACCVLLCKKKFLGIKNSCVPVKKKVNTLAQRAVSPHLQKLSTKEDMWGSEGVPAAPSARS